MKKDRKKFKDTKIGGFLKGVLPNILDVVGIGVPILAPVTNLIGRQINKEAIPVLTVGDMGKNDEITPKGERNNTKTILIWSLSIIILNALSAQFLGMSIPVKDLLKLVLSAFSG